MTQEPSWWNEKHESTWSRVKAALKRDWEQTKSDFTKHHPNDLDQSAGDTVKQAAGKEVIPPEGVPNPSTTWEHVEPSYRYGAGARTQFGTEHKSWDDKLESRLSADWTSLKNGRTWEEVKGKVRHAWDHSGT
jgi:hypothetical protein